MNNLQQYAQLYADIKAKEAELVALKIQIMKDMEEREVTKEETPYGKFTRASRKKYTYSPAIKSLQEKVDVAKIKEQQNGTAEVKETPYLLYNHD